MRALPFAIASAVFVSLPSAAMAQWPERVIKIIVPFLGGSSSDTIARIFANQLSKEVRQPVIVENRPGGSSIIGTDAIAKAAPDGYTLGFGNTSSHVATAVFTPSLPYDPIKDFTPIALVGTSPFVLIAPATGNIKSLPEYVAAAKASPGKLTYASAGTAALSHLAGGAIVQKTGISVVHVPYRGSGNSSVDLIAGRVDMMVGTIAPTISSYRTGQLRYFAVLDTVRNPQIPDVPTIAEAGAEGCEAALWTALIGPSGLPQEIVTRLNQLVAQFTKDPEFVRALANQGVAPQTGTPEELSQLIRSDLAKWKKVAEGLPKN